MGLFGRKKKKSDPPKQTNTNSFGEPLDRLTPEGELPWGWYTANKVFVDKLRAEYNSFFQKWIASRNTDPLTQYAEIKSFVLYMQDVKNLCASKGECFVYWRDELFTDEYLETRTKELKHIEANINQLQSEYQKRATELKNLDKRVEAVLKEHDGILQSDFVKLFDSSIHGEVRDKLYRMAQDGQLERVKSGRSYVLHIKKT